MFTSSTHWLICMPVKDDTDKSGTSKYSFYCLVHLLVAQLLKCNNVTISDLNIRDLLLTP